MSRFWKLTKYMPPQLRAALYAVTTSKVRLWLRNHLGGSARTIPDQIVSLPDGRKIHIGPDYIYWPVYIGTDFEPAATSVLRRLIRPGDQTVDVGANYGWYTTLLANLVGPTGHVYAFEPVPQTFERLSEHLQLNECADRVTVLESAVGATRGIASIHIFDALSHSRSSLATLGSRCCQTIAVPVVDLDTLFSECDVRRIDFLKCDVEGSELNVLQGSEALLRSMDAPIVMVEINAETSDAFNYKPRDIWNLLHEYGYNRFYRVASPGKLCRVRVPASLRRVNLLMACKGDRIERRMQSEKAAA